MPLYYSFDKFGKKNLVLDVHVTEENSGKYWMTGKHILADFLHQLPADDIVQQLNIRGTRLELSAMLSTGGDDDIYRVMLPPKMNVVEELNIELSEHPTIWNRISGDELTILLRALPNVKRLTISCAAIDNTRFESINGVFDMTMQRVSLPLLVACNITTTYSGKVRPESAKVADGIKECLLASAPNLLPESLIIREVESTTARATFSPGL